MRPVDMLDPRFCCLTSVTSGSLVVLGTPVAEPFCVPVQVRDILGTAPLIIRLPGTATFPLPPKVAVLFPL